MNSHQTSMIDMVFAILIIATVVVPFALYLGSIVDPRLTVYMYTNQTYLGMQIILWVVIDLVLMTTGFLDPQRYHNNLLFLGVGIPAPIFYWEISRQRIRSIIPQTTQRQVEEHGNYDESFVPGPERHDL